MQDPLMEVRTNLLTTSNVTGGLGSANWGGVEIQKKVDTLIADTINRGVDFRPLISRVPIDQLTYHWTIRSNLGSTSKASFFSDGGTGTPYPSTKYGCYAMGVGLRADYEVSNLMLASSASYYEALGDEAACALDELKLAEEKAMICGADTGAYGITSAYNGLLQLMRWHSSNGGDTEGTAANKMADTGAMFGNTRADSALGKVFDVSYVLAGTVGTSTGVLELKHLDKAITLSDKHGAKGKNRIFLCSEERLNEVNQLLQPQQRFVNGAGQLALEGGFVVSTYRNIPLIGSRYMDKNGATNTTSWDSSTDADNSMYLLVLDEIEVRVVSGVDAQHVLVAGEVSGTAGYNRADSQGGFFKTYSIFIFRSFQQHVHVANLTAPA